MSGCIGEPVSWLRLERYRLGELSETERSSVLAHLALCPACGACLRQIEQPIALEPLPPMAAKPKRASRWPSFFALAGAAAALALVLWRGVGVDVSRPGPRLQTKGGEFAIELVRLDESGRQQEPTHFSASDRFEVLLTSPADATGTVDVVIFQDGRAYFPLERAPLESGNRKTLPGAFRLDGASAAEVCAVPMSDPLDRARLERGSESLPSPTVCTRLVAAR